MRKLFAVIAIFALVGVAFAASVAPVVKGFARMTKSPDYRTTTYTMATAIVTNARNDTIVFARGSGNPWFDNTSIVTLMGKLKTNLKGNDSNDVGISLLLGADSAAWYVPYGDTINQRMVMLNADTSASGLPTLTNYYKSFYRALNDSLPTYPLYALQPRGNTLGLRFAIPIKFPEGYAFTRFALVLSKTGTLWSSGDTVWLTNAFITTTDYIK